MWPFKNKSKIRVDEPSPYKRRQDMYDMAIRRFERFRKIGETFTYMGITMTVTQHIGTSFGGLYTPTYIVPEFCANYVNNNGDIKDITFCTSELSGLIAENNERSE